MQRALNSLSLAPTNSDVGLRSRSQRARAGRQKAAVGARAAIDASQQRGRSGELLALQRMPLRCAEAIEVEPRAEHCLLVAAARVAQDQSGSGRTRVVPSVGHRALSEASDLAVHGQTDDCNLQVVDETVIIHDADAVDALGRNGHRRHRQHALDDYRCTDFGAVGNECLSTVAALV